MDKTPSDQPVVNNHWTTENIASINKSTGFCKVNDFMSDLFYTANISLVIYTWFRIACSFFNWPEPEFLIDYTRNPVCTINALLLMVLYNGHDRYYNITQNTLVLSDHIFLQCIDFWTKGSLIVVSILQLIYVESFVAICCYGYVLTFVRALYLSIKLDNNHPVAQKVKETWLPNNKRHNMVMLLWVVLYYFLLTPDALYSFLSTTLSIPVDFHNDQAAYALYITRLAFLVIFDIYWIFRVLRKVKIKKNRAFSGAKEKKLYTEVDNYYATKDFD